MEKKGAFDYILLETTGLADPGNLAPLFWVDDGLGSTIYLDGIVTLVDAKNILLSLDDPTGKVAGHEEHDDHGPLMTTAHVQISHADVIVINKADLVSEDDLRRVRERIESINGLAKVHITEKSIVPQLEGFLLDLHAYDQFNESEAKVKGHSHLDPVSPGEYNEARQTFVLTDRRRRYQQSPYQCPVFGLISWTTLTAGCGQCCGTTSSRVQEARARATSRSTAPRAASSSRTETSRCCRASGRCLSSSRPPTVKKHSQQRGRWSSSGEKWRMWISRVASSRRSNRAGHLRPGRLGDEANARFVNGCR